MEFAIYEEQNSLGHPMEDYCLVGQEGNTFAVADGVTRDTYSGDMHFRGSGSAEAARIFCDRVISHLQCGDANDQDVFVRAFDAANSEIAGLNTANLHREPREFLENDDYGTVGVAAIIDAGANGASVRYGYMGDCRIAVARRSGALDILNPDALINLYPYLDGLSFQSMDERRTLVRSQLRNAPAAVDHQDRTVGYGVFTGDPQVKAFYGAGEVQAATGDAIMLFSDGITEFLDEREFLRCVYAYLDDGDADGFGRSLSSISNAKAAEGPKAFRDDKTLITIRV